MKERGGVSAVLTVPAPLPWTEGHTELLGSVGQGSSQHISVCEQSWPLASCALETLS